ncbi:MAG: vWA domain-containing protein [Candidatus Thorarchaeota archaeon]
MLNRSDDLNSEEFIFYIDMISDFLKKRLLMKVINSFIKEKDKFNALSSYGIVIFQKDENPINEYDIKDSESVLNIISNSWDTRETTQSYLENGLYEILAYIFRKSRESRKNYRVIIISDTPSKLSEDYYNALYDLLIKAKKFSAFIDIIRVGNEKFYEDDVKLKVISSETHGGMFYCQDEKLLQNILGSLVQNKKEFKVIKTDEMDHVLPEDKVFYERLAVDLISLSSDDEEICTICEQELCPICEAHTDEIHKCFNCSAKFHSCCAAKYSLAKNIGFRHIFRCPQCETLLKLDEDYVNMVYEEDLEEELPEIETKSVIQTESEELKHEQEEPEEEAQIEEGEIEEEGISLDELKPPSPPAESTKKVKVGGFFGKEIEIKLKKEIKPTAEVDQPIEEKKKSVSITNLKPPRKRGSGAIKLCKICGATIQNTKNCPICGNRIT